MAENTAFRSAIKGFNRDDVINYISGLMEKNAVLERNAAALQQSQQEAAEACDLMRAEHDGLVQERDALQKEREDLQKECEDLRKELADQSGGRDSLQKAYDGLRNEYDALRKEYDALKEAGARQPERAEAPEAPAGYDGLRDKLAVLERMHERLGGEYDALKAEHEQTKAQCGDLDHACKKLAEKNEALKEKCAQLEREGASAEMKLGSAMLEAKRFSDMLVREAQEKAGGIYREACESVARSVESTARLDGQMTQLSEAFKSTMDGLRWEMTGLIGQMTAFCENARENADAFLGQEPAEGDA